MNLKQYLIIMTAGAVAGWFGWIWIIFQFDPFQTGALGIGLFYLTLALAVIGTYSVAGFCVKRLLIKSDELIFRQVKQTLRHATFLAIVIIALLMLQTHRSLNWLTLIGVIGIAILIEAVIARRGSREATYAN